MRTTLRTVAAIVLGVLALDGYVAQAATAHPSLPSIASGHPDVIVVGVTGLRWDAVGPLSTPSLWQFAATSALGVASVKAAVPVSCAEDGWLTLGAGDRANAFAACTASPVVQAQTSGGAVIDLGALVARNRRATDATHIGALAAAVGAAGGCVSAAGADAALAATTSAGAVSDYRADPLVAAADPGFLTRCPVTLISADMGSVDEVVETATAAAPDAVVLVVGVSDTDRGAAHLHAAMARGPGFTGGRLTSASTRRANYVQLVDVAPTILAVRGIAVPSSMIGLPWRTSSGGPARSLSAVVGDLNDLDLHAQRQEQAVVPFFVTQVCVMVIVGLLAWLVARRGSWVRFARPTQIACTVVALIPAASFLVGLYPWWRSSAPTAALMVGTALIAAGLGLLALALDGLTGRSRFGVAAAVGAITTAVIGIDLLVGGPLEIFTMNGYSPLVAGRFEGIGNVAFAVFGGATVLLAAGLFERFGLRGLGVGGAVVVVLDGGPPWGSDVGGVLSLVPALALLACLLGGFTVSWPRAVGTVAAAVALVALLGVIDYARPPDHQTHLGRFIGRVLHGGAWTIVRRKAVADVDLLTHSAVTLLIPVLVVAAVIMVRRPRGVLLRACDDVPVLRPTLIALLTLSLIAALVNDSGVVVPAVLTLLALPVVMAVVVSRERATSSPGNDVVAANR